MPPQNLAAWIRVPKGNLDIGEAPYYKPGPGEVLIKNEAICMQPFDARVRQEAYMKSLPYPFILGNSVAGTIAAVGADVKQFEIGDRVVSSTPAYVELDPKYGGWQRYQLSKAAITAKIGKVDFSQAVAVPFALSTAVGALQIALGMERPGQGAHEKGKVLIWGAGSSVGGYAVQYAKSVGYTVIATASPRGADHLLSIGASNVLDYKSPTIEAEIRALGPFKFFLTASGDPKSQQTIASLLQPNGGEFASTLGGEVPLPDNVERIFESFERLVQLPHLKDYADWWFGDYLPKALNGSVEVSPFVKRKGGLAALQEAGDDVVAKKVKEKLVINPQED